MKVGKVHQHALVLHMFYILLSAARIDKLDRRTLVFIQEPKERIDFYNTTGAEVPCTARGNPAPMIRWETRDGSPVKDVPGLRHVRPDGSLVFSPFHADNYRQDVHAAVYRCTASNNAGRIGSRDVHVRGRATATAKDGRRQNVISIFVSCLLMVHMLFLLLLKEDILS